MSWITTGFKFLPLIVEAVRSVEKIVKKKDESNEPRYEHGKHKQDSALHLVEGMLRSHQRNSDLNLLHDAEVQLKVREIIDNVVALENLLTKKARDENTRL